MDTSMTARTGASGFPPQITSRRRAAGMTLIELMIVVMVIGILGMIAVPSYRQFVMRSQRTEAKNALLQIQTNQERFYLANRTYGTMAALVAANLGSATSERGTYAITIAGADATTYTATATPVAGGAVDMTTDAACTSFSITAQGLRTHTGDVATACW